MTTAGDGRRRRGLGRSRELGRARPPTSSPAAPPEAPRAVTWHARPRGGRGRGEHPGTWPRGHNGAVRRARGFSRLPASRPPRPAEVPSLLRLRGGWRPFRPPRPPVPGNTSEPPWRTWRLRKVGARGEGGARPSAGRGWGAGQSASLQALGGGRLPARPRFRGAPCGCGVPAGGEGEGLPAGFRVRRPRPVGGAAAEPARPFLRLALDPVFRAKKEKKRALASVDDDLEDDLEGIAQLPQSRTELGGLHVQVSGSEQTLKEAVLFPFWWETGELVKFYRYFYALQGICSPDTCGDIMGVRGLGFSFLHHRYGLQQSWNSSHHIHLASCKKRGTTKVYSNCVSLLRSNSRSPERGLRWPPF
ncbi:uncharacterized protein LOC144288156 [Canis aureus]